MKILLIADPLITVPPIRYGGIERVVGQLAEEYLLLGHEVSILASKGSYIQGCKIYFNGKSGYPQSKKDRFLTLTKTWFFLIFNYKKFDLIQNFGRLLYLLPVLKTDIKKIMCYQRKITVNNIICLQYIFPKNLILSGCSRNLISSTRLVMDWSVVYNPVKTSLYNNKNSIGTKSPLIFLSRLNKEKGCHIAIEIAKLTGEQLIIAGNVSIDNEEHKYFKELIEPNIDGTQIIYVGELDDVQKNHYLGLSKAMLFPIIWDEPFGIVMVEAMACGTPVIAFNRGAVDEVIDEGITGFKVRNKEEMISAISKIDKIDRSKCREQVKKRFGISKIATDYLSI